MITIATAVAKNFLPYARVLAESLQQWHPELRLVALLVDDPQGCFDVAEEPMTVLPLSVLPIPEVTGVRLKDLCFRYNRRELVSALKPFLLLHLLERGDQTVLFLDADIAVLRRMDALLSLAQQHSLLLTPHHAAIGAGSTTELNVLQSGVYNGGVIGCSDRPETREFLRWWGMRCATLCRHAFAQGLHFDQRWLDFAPSFIADLAILRDPNMHVAYWNLHQAGAAEQWKLFHFSGFSPDRPELLTRYRPEAMVEQAGVAEGLYREYSRRVMRAGYAEAQRWPYAFDRLRDGTPISQAARDRYRQLGRAAAYFQDPFGPEIKEWLLEEEVTEESPELRMWRTAANERLAKLEEANRLLATQQRELDDLKNQVGAERQRSAWLAGKAEMFERAATERLALLEKTARERGWRQRGWLR